MKPNFIEELVEASEQYYDSSQDLHRIKEHARAVDRDGGDMHQIVDAQCRMASQKGETLRAAGALLRAVEAYRGLMYPDFTRAGLVAAVRLAISMNVTLKEFLDGAKEEWRFKMESKSK